MNISAPFIRRPVGTVLLTVAIALAGMVAPSGPARSPCRAWARATWSTEARWTPAAARADGFDPAPGAKLPTGRGADQAVMMGKVGNGVKVTAA